MDFAIKNGELLINNGDFTLCKSDIDAIQQNIIIRLKTLSGEWFLDKNEGLPYIQSILGKKNGQKFLPSLLANEIKKIPEIKDLSQFSFEEDSSLRSLKISFQVKLHSDHLIQISETIGV